MNKIKVKLLSFTVTLLMAFGAVFSAVFAVTQAKAYDGADVEIRLDEEEFNAGEIDYFDVGAYSEKGFSSYELTIDVPSFLDVERISSGICGDNNEGKLEWYFARNNSYNVNYTSTTNEMGYCTLFTVQVRAKENTQGQTGTLWVDNARFTNTQVDHLSVETDSAFFRVNGESMRMKGDFNRDGTVSIEDVMLLQRVIANRSMSVMSDELYAGDIDNNGELNIYDCQYIRSYLIGLIDSLENISGGDPQGGDIYGDYYISDESGNTFTLTLNADKSYMIACSDGGYETGCFKRVETEEVYLIRNYYLIKVYLDTDKRTFTTYESIDFSIQSATATGFEGTYLVNGATDETITIAYNGAFVRNCYEDGHLMQYNGMISIKEMKDGMYYGTAYVFGGVDSSPMSMSFRLDKKNNVIYVDQGQYSDTYRIMFYVDGEMVAVYPAVEGTYYAEVFNQFLKDKGEMLNKKFGYIDFDDYDTNTGNGIHDGSCITCDDEIYFYAKGTEEWYEDTSSYSVNFGEQLNLYFYSTGEDVSRLLIGRRAQVLKNYHSKQGYYKSEYYKDITITKDMIGELSTADFTPNGPQNVEVRLYIEGRTARINIWLIPDMTGATFLKTGIMIDSYDDDGETRYNYYAYKIYDNNFVATYSVNERGEIDQNVNGYFLFETENYNGVTLYSRYGYYAWFSGKTVTLAGVTYDVLEEYRSADEDETDDYTLQIVGAGTVIFKVFNGEFAEIWSMSYGSIKYYYEGTVKAVIEGDSFTVMGTTYTIGANNVLYIPLPDEEPLFTTVIQGADVYFYEDGRAYIAFDGVVMYDMTWEAVGENYSVIHVVMMGEEMYLYKWEIDGSYHGEGEEPDWKNPRSVKNFVYNRDGEIINYTLYTFGNGMSYLLGGGTVQYVNTIGNNIFCIYTLAIANYYYYNEEGEMYDAVRYHIELSEEVAKTLKLGNNHFGYVYEVPAKDIMVGYWEVDGVEHIDDTFTYVVEDGNYVVSVNVSWLFTATPEMAISTDYDNKLILVNFRNRERFFASHSGSQGGADDEGKYDLNVYNVFNGKIMGGATYMPVESFDEFAAYIDEALDNMSDEGAPTFIGYYYDMYGKEPVSERNFRSGDVYLLFIQRSDGSEGNASGNYSGSQGGADDWDDTGFDGSF